MRPARYENVTVSRNSPPGQVWKLCKSLYGLAQSPRNHFLYTRDKLIKMGFVQSEADPCLFISNDIICLIYVDDALLFYKDKESINSEVPLEPWGDIEIYNWDGQTHCPRTDCFKLDAAL
jgi:hypothetical protein